MTDSPLDRLEALAVEMAEDWSVDVDEHVCVLMPSIVEALRAAEASGIAACWNPRDMVDIGGGRLRRRGCGDCEPCRLFNAQYRLRAAITEELGT